MNGEVVEDVRSQVRQERMYFIFYFVSIFKCIVFWGLGNYYGFQVGFLLWIWMRVIFNFDFIDNYNKYMKF